MATPKLLVFCTLILFAAFSCNPSPAPTQTKLEAYKQAELFNHLSQAQYDSVVEGLIMENVSLEQVLLMFPDLTYLHFFELGDAPMPYKELLLNLARISRGKFEPTDIQDGFERTKDEFPFSFNWQGQTYQTILTVSKDSDLIDLDFIRFINKIVAAETTGHRFEHADRGYFILLNEEQFQLFEKDSLINAGLYGKMAPFIGI